MKKMTIILLLAALTCCVLAGCVAKNSNTSSTEESSEQPPADSAETTYADSAASADNIVIEKDFGSYSLLSGWIESETHSTSTKYFYVLEGTDNDPRPNNISVNVGTNRYSKENTIDFGRAILKQLAVQVSENEEIAAGGINTDAGDPLLTFTIASDDGSVTKQYYVVGDSKYCLIHLTNFDGSEDANSAADLIASSFKWAD